MSIGFLPSGPRRQPVYSAKTSEKLGYVVQDGGSIWFLNADGVKLGKVLRYKQDAFEPSASVSTGIVMDLATWFWEE